MADTSKHRIPAAAGAVAAGGAIAAGKLVRDRVAQRSGKRRERAYRLQPDETPAEGIRRIARGQIDLARDQLAGNGESDVGDAVHEARKAFKRLRALLRLARDELGDRVYRRENATFRAAGRVLSDVRDSAVLVETLDAITTRYADELPRGAFGGLREALAAEAQAAHDALENGRGAVDRVQATLDTARGRVARWPLPDDGDLAALQPGFKRVYRRGRRALRAADDEGGTERLHELRKRAKDLWHAAQVLRPADPKTFKRLGRRAHDLSDLVGEDHDLAVLLDAARERHGTLARGERELLVALVGRRRAELQRAALARGRKVYARRPRKLAKLIRGAPAR
jgi:CHAD domain-containing protein